MQHQHGACITYMATSHWVGMRLSTLHSCQYPAGGERGYASTWVPSWAPCWQPTALPAGLPQTGSSARCWLQTPDPAQSAGKVASLTYWMMQVSDEKQLLCMLNVRSANKLTCWLCQACQLAVCTNCKTLARSKCDCHM